ncbi:hypothetical protein BJ741DRAFT_609886 [Chytriomyces cf. hyalinus JEL632]|nr:hypothetical protein BJ741DRAFT_609886 [Chytriomyces cf. hyalinus JEL632]
MRSKIAAQSQWTISLFSVMFLLLKSLRLHGHELIWNERLACRQYLKKRWSVHFAHPFLLTRFRLAINDHESKI